MSRHISWLIFILITNAASMGQDLSSTLSMAEVNLNEGRYADAEMLYRRVLFFDSSYRYQTETIKGLATISFRTGQFDASSKYYLTLSRITGQPAYYYAHILSLLKDGFPVLPPVDYLLIQLSKVKICSKKHWPKFEAAKTFLCLDHWLKN